MAVVKKNCFELHGRKDLGKLFRDRVDSGMSEKEAARKTILEEHEKLHNDLNDLKLKVNPKAKIEKYSPPDNSKEIEKINADYEAKAKAAPIPDTPKAAPTDIGTTEETGKAAEEGTGGGTPPKNAPGEAVGGEDLTGITHEQMDQTAKELGLETYQKDPETVQEWDAAANKRLKDPNAISDLLNKMRKGKQPDAVEQRMMIRYISSLKAKIRANPTPDLLAEFKRARDLSNIVGGRDVAKSLAARKAEVPVEDTLADYLINKQEAQGFTLSEKQIEEQTKKYNELKKAKDELEAALIIEKETNARLVAEHGLNKAKAMIKKSAKKTHEEYVAERKGAVDAAREALKKIREGGLQSGIPGARELAAIAPHVKKAVQSLLEEGISKIDDIVTDIHANFKDALDGLTKKDVIDIIGGVHDEKKETLNQKASALRLIKREAQLMNELDAARKGEEKAKTEKERGNKSRRIEELETKIKEVREKNKKADVEESPEEKSKELKTDTEKDKSYAKSLEARIKKLETDIKNKQYAPEPVKRQGFPLSKKTQALKDKVIELEKQKQLERYKDERAKMSKWQKGWDHLQNVLGVRRIVQTAVDASIWFRQLGQLVFNPRKWPIAKKFIVAGSKSVFSQKNYDRIMDEIHHADDFKETVDDGIRYNELDAPQAEKRNEFYPTSFIYKIPFLRQVIRASQRIADSSLNVARYELYQKYKERLLKQGITRESDPEMYKDMAKLVMNTTGSGNMLQMLENGKAEKVMGATFYGARLMAANFNTLNPVYYAKMSKEVRMEAMKDLASYTTTLMVTALALSAAGGSIQLDPDKPDFLQIRFGSKVYDLTGGKAAYIRTFLRWVEAGHARLTKSKYEANKALEFAGGSTMKFFRNKLAPNTGYIVNAVSGKDAIGRDFKPQSILTETMPLYVDDAYKAAKEDGLSSLLTVLMPNLLGVGYNSYYSEPNEKPLDDLLQRNLRSDEMNKETIKNYKEGGRQINNKEFSEFSDNRDSELQDQLTKLYNDGLLVLRDNKVVKVPFKDLTREEIIKETSAIKAKATDKIKEQMFGEKKQTTEEKRASMLLQREKKRQSVND